MRLLNEQDKEVKLEDCDLSNGYIITEIIIKDDAEPIDNVKKYAWADEDYETIQRYVVIPERRRYENEIDNLKAQLSSTDYAVIKIAEGAATSEDYAQLIADREEWRTRVNELQEKLDALNAQEEESKEE